MRDLFPGPSRGIANAQGGVPNGRKDPDTAQPWENDRLEK